MTIPPETLADAKSALKVLGAGNFEPPDDWDWDAVADRVADLRRAISDGDDELASEAAQHLEKLANSVRMVVDAGGVDVPPDKLEEINIVIDEIERAVPKNSEE